MNIDLGGKVWVKVERGSVEVGSQSNEETTGQCGRWPGRGFQNRLDVGFERKTGDKADSKVMVQAPGRMELPFTMMGDGGWVGQWGTSWHVLCGVHWTSRGDDRQVIRKIWIWNFSAYDGFSTTRLGEVNRVWVWIKQGRGPKVDVRTLQHSEVSRGTESSGRKIPSRWRSWSQGMKQFPGEGEDECATSLGRRGLGRSLVTVMGSFIRVCRVVSRAGNVDWGRFQREREGRNWEKPVEMTPPRILQENKAGK